MKNADRLLVVGHRGAKGLALENTAPSIEAAIAYGVDMVEIDLRVSKDGQLVLLHDEDAVARNGQIVHVSNYTLKELTEFFPDILTLDALLKQVNGRCKIMLEFKVIEAVDPTIKILKKQLQSERKPADFMFASFKYDILKKLRASMPAIDLVVLDNWSSIRAVYRARHLQTDYLSMDQRYLWWGVIHNLSKRYKLFCYPNHKLIHIKHAKPLKWAKYGLYGVITDYPNFFLPKQPTSIVDTNESHISSQRAAH